MNRTNRVGSRPLSWVAAFWWPFFFSCLFVKKMDTMMIEGEGMLTYYRTNRVGKRKSGIKKKKKKNYFCLSIRLDLTIRYDVCPSWLSVCEPPGDELREQMSLRVFPFFFFFFLSFFSRKRKEKKKRDSDLEIHDLKNVDGDVVWGGVYREEAKLATTTDCQTIFFFFFFFLWHRIALTISLLDL